jgi:hypothetical protein
VVEVTVCEQHGGRLEAVLRKEFVELALDSDTGIDHHTLLAGGRGNDVAIRAERLRRKPGDQHL